MAGQITYEVYVQQGARWEIHSRYNAVQKDEAIQEAKALESMPGVDAAKVVKEVYDAREGKAEEFTVYKSEALRRKTNRDISSAKATAPPVPRPGRAPERSPAISPRAPTSARRPGTREGRPPARRSSLVAVLVKILLIILLSVAAAAALTILAANYLPHTKVFDVWLTGNTRQNALFGVFIVGFIISTLITAKIFLAKEDFIVPMRGRRRAPPARPGRRPASGIRQGRDLERLEESLPEPDAQPIDTALEDEEDAAEEEGSEPDEPAPAPSAISPKAEQQKRYMMQFLGNSLQKTPAAQKLDNFNKFGVNLFLAGACEVLAKHRGLGSGDEATILSEGVQIMGFNRQAADGFAQKKEEYLLADSRYMQMYQAGRNAMSSALEGDPGAETQLEKALADWNTPKAREVKNTPITVMFTDMVGSTALTQQFGDAVAQEVVRAHNRVVREALQRFAGREIKHTGDGIMAAFDSTSNGVEAAIMIQHGAAAHTKANPGLPLNLKIGINAGEPIREDDDLFGSTVQLSARIVDKASKGQIYVSEIVRGICAGKAITFRNVGDFQMKGFSDPITLYEVEWDRSAASAQAAE